MFHCATIHDHAMLELAVLVVYFFLLGYAGTYIVLVSGRFSRLWLFPKHGPLIPHRRYAT